MIEVVNEIKCRGSILSIGLGAKNIFVLDAGYHLNVLSSRNLTPLKTFLLEKKAKPLHQFSNAMCVGSTKELLYSVNETEKTVHLTLTKGLERHEINQWHNGDVNCVKFSPSTDFYITGGADGRSHLFKTDGDVWLNSYEPRPDYVSAITFSDDESKVVLASFDGVVSIYDIERNAKLHSFQCESVAEDVAFFEEGTKVCVVTRERSIYTFDLSIKEEKVTQEAEEQKEQPQQQEKDKKEASSEVKENKPNEQDAKEKEENQEENDNTLHKRVKVVKNAFEEWPTTIAVGEQGLFALVGTKKNRVHIIYLKTLQIIKSVSFENQGVSHLKLGDESLYVGFADGSLFRVERNVLADEFKEALDKDNFSEANLLIEKNELLCLNKAYLKFETSWPIVLQEAVDLIEQNKLEEADAKVKPFIVSNKLYSEEYLQYFSNHKDIKNFIDYVNVKNYAEAYAAAELNPEIEKLHAYQKLEEHWQIVFKRAKELISSGVYDDSLKAEKLMQPFMKVPKKKKLSLHLIANGAVFEKAEALVKQKQFKAYFGLVKKYPFLEDVALYQKVINYAETIYEKVIELEHVKEFDKAIYLLETLIFFPPFRELAKNSIAKIKTYSEFVKKIAASEYVQAYNMADQNPYLQVGEDFVALKEIFKTTYELAEKKAELGKPSAVLETLDIYLKVDYWSQKIKNVMQKAYLNEMEMNVDNTDIDWTTTFETYVNIFGKNMQLQQVAKEIHKTAIFERLEDVEVDEEIPSSSYVHSILVEMAGTEES